MPRSLARPNVSTYHEATHALITALGIRGLPLTKKGNKFTAKSLAYIAGRFSLPITATIKDIYAELVSIYAIPDEFIIKIRVMQQLTIGVSVPESYGTEDENMNHILATLDRIKNPQSDTTPETDDQMGEVECEPVVILGEDTEVNSTPCSEYGEKFNRLAAENPIAAQFARAILKQPLVDTPEDDDTEVCYQYEPEEDDCEGYLENGMTYDYLDEYDEYGDE